MFYQDSGLNTNTRKDLERFPLLRYVYNYWPHYIKSLTSELQEEILQLLIRLIANDSIMATSSVINSFLGENIYIALATRSSFLAAAVF
jgi:hypothetical protein